MKKTIIFLQMLLMAAVGFAGPTYDATYHLISESYSLNQDGSLDYHFRKELQLFSKASFDTYGETFIWYNPEYQTLTINEAYTIRKDGSKVQTPSNAFNPSLPYACENCERFNSIREMVVTHTALEYDATIVLDYTIHTEQPFMKEIIAHLDLYANVPIDKYLIKFIDYSSGEKVEVPFEFSGIYPGPDRTYLPESYLPTANHSTLADLPAFLRRLSQQNAFFNQETPFKDELNNIVKQSATDMENILAIRDYVADNILENDVPMRYMGYLIASPATVWNTNCGTPFEKNLLLNAMLKEAGYQSAMGVYEKNWQDDPESAVQVIVGGETYYLSSSNTSNLSLESTHLSNNFYTMSGESFMAPASNLLIQSVANVKVVRDGNAYKAQVEERVAKVESPKTNTLLPKTHKLCNARVSNLNSNYWQLKVNNSNYGCDLRASAIARERWVDVAVTPTDEQYSYTVEIPGYARWVTQDRIVEKKYDFGSVRVEQRVVNDKMIVTRHLIINDKTISGKKQIQQFREMIAEWNAEQPLIFVIL
ncbi:MAG: DUF3857 domain-containing protein [Bacteroidales bacterium]|nr:DUF3857 domain-containing protein [Bacteroidales bacterium]